MSDSHAPASAGQHIQLSWILPMYRTAAMLDELLRRLHATASEIGVGYEVILVDDACPQHSAVAARLISQDHPLVSILVNDQNRGQDQTLLRGLAASRGEWCIIMDADLQDPPEVVSQLWRHREAGIDGIFAGRMDRFHRIGRKLTSTLYRQAIRHIGGLPAGACLFALLSRPIVGHILERSRPDSWLLPLIAASGGRFISVPIAREARPGGQSGYSSMRRVRKAAGSLWQMIQYRYLR